MTWTFKDRFNPHRRITIDGEFLTLLIHLEDTFEDFRYYNSLDADAQNQLTNDKGVIFAKVIFIHTQISYCLGTHDCQEDFYYEFYCTTVRKYLVNVHPRFAMKKYAEFISYIQSENESTTPSITQKEKNNELTDDH